MNSCSSFWHKTGGGYSQAVMQGGSKDCRCARRCRCSPGGTCRCRSGCTCKQTRAAPEPSRVDMWTEASEGELRRPSAFHRSMRTPYVSSRQHSLRPRAQAAFQRRLFMQRQWRRRAGLNSFYSRRFGWGRHTRQIAGMLGCSSCRPGSPGFAMALARWQRRNGLPANGVMTPALWWHLRRSLFSRPGVSSAAYSMPYPSMQPLSDAPPWGAIPEPAMGPPEAPPGDAPTPATDGGAPPEDAAGSEEFGIGFRARRLQPGSPEYYRALRPYGPQRSLG